MSNCIVVAKAVIDQALSNDPATGKRSLEPVHRLAVEEGLPFKVLEDVELKENEAEVHRHEGDLWYCLQGEITFIYGGELVDPWNRKNADGTTNENEVAAPEIRGGETVVLKPGDWLWIPAGEPHQHTCAGVARLAIIKIPAK